MSIIQSRAKKQRYKYPDRINSLQRIQQINMSEQFPVYVSLLHAGNETLFDIRIWSKDQPTNKGIFLTHAGGLRLIDLLDSFLAGEDLTDQADEAIISMNFGNSHNVKTE